MVVTSVWDNFAGILTLVSLQSPLRLPSFGLLSLIELSFAILTNQGWVIGGPCSFTPSPAEPSNFHPLLHLLPPDNQQTTPERKPFSRSTDQVVKAFLLVWK